MLASCKNCGPRMPAGEAPASSALAVRFIPQAAELDEQWDSGADTLLAEKNLLLQPAAQDGGPNHPLGEGGNWHVDEMVDVLRSCSPDCMPPQDHLHTEVQRRSRVQFPVNTTAGHQAATVRGGSCETGRAVVNKQRCARLACCKQAPRASLSAVVALPRAFQEWNWMFLIVRCMEQRI